MAHLTSLMTVRAARTTERRGSDSTGNAAGGVSGTFESVAELGDWVRVAMLSVFAPEFPCDAFNDECVATVRGECDGRWCN